MSAYYLEHANVDHIQKHFDDFEEEARSLLSLGLPIPAYDQVLKASHAFNILDSRGFVGVTERARYFGRMRSLARQCSQLWLKTREEIGYPLGTYQEANLVYPHVSEKLSRKEVLGQAQTFVLEIGTEELPPHDVVEATEQLEKSLVQILGKRRLSHGKVHSYGTPRRLAVVVENLSLKQMEEEVELRGPPVTKAFDQEGKPTKAAEGFCRKNNVPLDSLYRKIDGKTEYIYARVKESARYADERSYLKIYLLLYLVFLSPSQCAGTQILCLVALYAGSWHFMEILLCHFLLLASQVGASHVAFVTPLWRILRWKLQNHICTL
uniref:glycine--tRNA ligase n=1 Tax=Aegilops tauschii subsp. strangulata TaxID=200361 RepID=A0A453QAA6_AEGTS